MTEGIEDTEYPFGATLEEMDVPAFFNMREWLEKALRSQGASVQGKGVGMGQADIDITIDGARFNVSIKPLPALAALDASSKLTLV